MPYVQSALDDEDRVELDALRVRAYGPHADIDQDAAAVARLAQLEAAAHSGIVVIDDTSMLDAAAASDIRDAVFGAVDRRADVEAGPAAPVAPAAPATPAALTAPVAEPSPPAGDAGIAPAPPIDRPRRRRSLRALGWTALGAAVGGLAVTMLSASPTPDVDAVLHPMNGAADTPARSSVALSAGVEQLLSTSASDYTRFEDYQGIAVIAEQQPDGIRCLMVMTEVFAGWINSCVPRGMDPVIDLSVYDGAPYDLYDPGTYNDLPTGSIVRMTWVDQEVRVEIGHATDAPPSG